jgi:hypothetical protein
MSSQPSVPATTAPQPIDTQSSGPTEDFSQYKSIRFPISEDILRRSSHPDIIEFQDKITYPDLTPNEILDQPQAYILLRSRSLGWGGVLKSQLHISAVRQSMALATRLAHHQLAKASLPTRIKDLFQEYCRLNIWTIILEEDVHENIAGRVSYDHRNRIFLNFEVSLGPGCVNIIMLICSMWIERLIALSPPN